MIFYSLIAAAVAFIVTLFTIPSFIRFYHKAKIGGQQMHEDVKQHAAKAGTPTMGGVVFVTVSLVIALLSALVSSLLTANFMILWFVFAMFAVVGFLDDFFEDFQADKSRADQFTKTSRPNHHWYHCLPHLCT